MEIVKSKAQWLWRWGRTLGLLPVSFASKTCTCSTQRPKSSKIAPDRTAPAVGRCKRCGLDPGAVILASSTWSSYSLGLAAFLVLCTAVVLVVDVRRGLEGNSARMKTKMDRLVTISDLGMVLLSGVVGILQAWCTRRSIGPFVEDLHTVDQLLRSPSPRVPVLLLVWLLMLGLLCVLDVLAAALNHSVSYAILFIPGQANYILTYTMEAMFAEDAYYDRGGAVPDPWMHAFSVAKAGWSGPTSKEQAETSPGSLHRLQDAHALLCASSSNVTHRYGVVVLIDVLNLLLHLVVTAFFFFKELLDGRSHEAEKGALAFLQIVWLGSHMGRLVLLVTPCSKAKEEANRTGALVGMFLNTVHPDSSTFNQLEMFAMQLLHHRVYFSASGLFDLDLPLVVSVLGAVTTYLVVLLQLQVPPATST